MSETAIHILLIEDNPGDVRLLQELLESETGMQVASANSLQQGLIMAKKGRFDVVLLDLTLPDSSGLETVSKAATELPQTPLVVLTGLGDEQTGLEALKVGAQDYLVKGQIERSLLVRSIRYAIERHQILEALKRANDALEMKVKERTAELHQTVERLKTEVAEHRKAERALQESHELLETMFRNIHLCVAYMDRNFNFIRVNDAYAAADGKETGFFTGKNHFDLYPNRENQAIFKEVLRTGRPVTFYQKLFEYSNDPARGTTYWDWTLYPVKDPEGAVTGLVLSLRDVTEHVRSQAEVERVHQRLFSVLNMLPGYVVLKDCQYRIRYANHGFLEEFSEPGDRPCYRVQRGLDQPCEDCPLHQVIRHKQPKDWEWTYPSGRSYHTWVFPFVDKDGTELMLEFGIDVSERRELERLVSEAGEAERRRVGRDLHDTLGQTLTGLGYMIGGLAGKLAAHVPQEQDRAKQIVSAINEAVAQIRALAQGLDPVGLETEGLADALMGLAANITKTHGISCLCHADGLVAVDARTATHLYRIAQEATNNAVKHARPTQIAIRLDGNGDEVTLTVTDDGVGLPQDLAKSKGMGLRIMRYRADAIGATMLVKRQSSGGTAVVCRLGEMKALPPT